MRMRFNRWTNPSLPQTLQIGMWLLYIDAVFGLLFGQALVLFPIGLLVLVGSALAGLGIANELRWGYVLGVIVSALALVPFVLIGAFDGIGTLLGIDMLLNMIFPIAQFVALVHPQSRSYQKIWFS
jgi:hypothetical protein